MTSSSSTTQQQQQQPQQQQRLDLRGIYPPIATPFNADESISYEQLRANFTKWNTLGFKGYVVQGSNGEYPYMRPDERVELVAAARAAARPEHLIIAGSGCESTRDTVDMSRQMAQAGADAVLVITPCYFKNAMTSEALEQHYTKVADASSVPVILYSVPANTGIDLAADVIVRLARHPNIIGLKDSAGDVAKLGAVVYRTRDSDFQVLAGSASFLYPALSVGCVGGVCALANVLGAECCHLQALTERGDSAQARELQQRLIDPNTAVTKRFGVAGLKAAMDWFGLYGGPTRAPLVALGAEDTRTLKRLFTSSGFHGA